MDDTNRLADYISQLKNLPHWKSTQYTEKSRGKPGGMAERSKAPDSRKSCRDFWYTSVCVGSNPKPVRKRFENDEADPSADKFYHIGTSIQDDSPKQKKTRLATSLGGW